MALFRFTVVFLALTCLMMGQMMVHGRSAGGQGLVYDDDDDFTERQARKAVLERNKRSSSSSSSSSSASSSASSSESSESTTSMSTTSMSTTSGLSLPATITLCENTAPAAITCPAGQTLMILSADYGRRDMTTCPSVVPSQVADINCRSAVAQPAVQMLCDGMVTCTIPTTSAALGNMDPCAGIFKYITVVYNCMA